MTFQEVLDICNAFIEDSENKEKVEAYNNMLNSLTIRSYLPMQEKVIALVRTVIDSDKDVDVPESMFTAGIEISCLFNGLLSYTNIDKPTNIDVKNYENYDTIYQSGLADYILDFCGKDYKRLVRMLERTMSFENLTDLIKSIQAIDLKELRKTVEELKDITKDVDPELVKNMADIMRFNDPNLSKLSDNLKENAADEAFKDKEDKEDLPKA